MGEDGRGPQRSMRLFDVYPLYDINIVKGEGCQVWDDKGQEYLDLYGGHAVISIGHCHPHYVQMLQEQLTKLGFYSNSVINRLQEQLAERLGKASGYEDYQLFQDHRSHQCQQACDIPPHQRPRCMEARVGEG